jgi:predicted phage tail protein
VFQIILDAVLIAASFIPFLAPVAPYMQAAGYSMITGGAIQLLTPHPKEIGIKDSPDNAASYP